jgi:hypothetical protein
MGLLCLLYVCITTFTFFESACSKTDPDDGEYLIVSSKYYWDTNRPPDMQRMRLFTIKHGKVTITAQCEVSDLRNQCRELEVGRKYRFTRGKQLTDLLSSETPHAVLGIESETMQ